MVKRKTKTKSKKNTKAKNLLAGLSWLQSGGGIFKGMAPVALTGNRVTIINTAPKGGYGPGHLPAPKFASLSDGSKLGLTGKNKGKIFK